jgi:signal transduction histidine kinase
MNAARLEALLAAGMATGLAAELLSRDPVGPPGLALAGALVTLPLAVRFRFPLGAVTAVSAGFLGLRLVGPRSADDAMFAIVALLLALYAVGSRATGWRFWAGGAVALAAGVASFLIREGATLDLLAPVGMTAAGLVIGRALGVLRLETDAIQERAERALADERARIARELHDVIGHSISVMGVQAGGVRRLLRPEQTREREALLAVEATGRQAVGEMRRLIGLLRTDEQGIAEPSPSLARVEHLATEMRRAGMALELCVEGDVRRLPPGPDLAGYRIVQEALTNALKHAPEAQVRATVRSCGDRLEIDVCDDGRGAPATTNGHPGHGLLGMRERTSLYGGRLSAGPRPEGGFGVHAQIPIDAP